MIHPLYFFLLSTFYTTGLWVKSSVLVKNTAQWLGQLSILRANHYSATSFPAKWLVRGVSNKPFGSLRDPLWIPNWMLMKAKFPQELIAVVWGSKSLQRAQCFTQFTPLMFTNFRKILLLAFIFLKHCNERARMKRLKVWKNEWIN